MCDGKQTTITAWENCHQPSSFNLDFPSSSCVLFDTHLYRAPSILTPTIASVAERKEATAETTLHGNAQPAQLTRAFVFRHRTLPKLHQFAPATSLPTTLQKTNTETSTTSDFPLRNTNSRNPHTARIATKLHCTFAHYTAQLRAQRDPSAADSTITERTPLRKKQ